MPTDSPKVPLTNKPGVTNWVERTHALEPHDSNWIYRCAEHLKGKGMPEGRAIPIAAKAAEKLCSTGDLNWPGIQHANFGSRAQACAAAAKWKAAAASTHLSSGDAAIFRVIDLAKVRVSKDAIDLAYDTATREKFAKQGKALPADGGGRFPISNRDDLAKAIQAVGRARPNTPAERAKVRRYIAKRAKALNAADLIPDSWKADGSLNLSAVVGEAVLDLAFNPSQARAPAGSATGGQFVAGGQKGKTAKGAQKKLHGKLSKERIMAFQKKHGLQVDGVIGHQTAAAFLGHKDAKNVKTGALSGHQREAFRKIASARKGRKGRKGAGVSSSGAAMNLSADSDATVDLAFGSQLVGPSGQFTKLGQKRPKLPVGGLLNPKAVAARLKQQHPHLTDKQAQRLAKGRVARRKARRSLGISELKTATPKQMARLKQAGLVGGKAGTTVTSHTITRGPRKGQTVAVVMYPNGKWREVRQGAGAAGNVQVGALQAK